MSTAQIEATIIFSAVICGVISAGYLYQSVSSTLVALRKALRLIAVGLACITLGVLLAAFILFSPQLGVESDPYVNALSYVFFLMYIAGSISILAGARQFGSRPARQVVDVSMGK